VKVPVAVLASGGGSNLQALIDACARPEFPARIAVVLSNLPTAGALERARRANIATEVLEHRAFASREDYDTAVVEKLRAHGVEWVCLAGFMRIITPKFLRAFSHRVLNIHPALLPSFPGMHGPRQALAYGVKIAGCTVHFVDEGTDTGPIISQAAVPVLEDDDESKLAARILEQEHRLYPEALALAVTGRLKIEGRRVLRSEHD
jgi:phosphoribosylglycinamide formyltransferase-1